MASRRALMLATAALVPASLLALLLLCEVFFRVAVPAPAIPAPAWIDGVLRHRPGQKGLYWHGNDYRTRFSINAQGWNSARAQYPSQRGLASRIAIVGDSYVEALQVPPDGSLAEELERQLPGTEAFRYGMSGAPLSQYLHMARRAALPDRPDILVVLLVHNDFDESYSRAAGFYTASFLTFDLRPGGGVLEVEPRPYEQGLLSALRNGSATWRYLAHGRLVNMDGLRRMLLPDKAPARHEANVDISGLEAREALDRRATAHGFAGLKEACAAAGVRLLLVMDGVRAGIEAGRLNGAEAEYSSGALRLNRMAGQEAARLGIPFLDLHPAFARDFRERGRPFAFPTDGHWNAHAHALAAREVAAKLRKLGWLPVADR